jgi:predicted glycosyltransferase involved in capsule biosynthesis
MPDFSLCIPFYSRDARRLEILSWLSRYYQSSFPTVELVVGFDTEYFDDDQVNRSKMRNNAVRGAKNETVLILDADCWLSEAAVVEAVTRVRAGAPVVQTHGVAYVSDAWTRVLLDANPALLRHIPDNYVHERAGICKGFLFGMTRATFERVGGFDERFVGWGFEDDAFVAKVEHEVGPRQEIAECGYHLSHARVPFEQMLVSNSFWRNDALANNRRAVSCAR